MSESQVASPVPGLPGNAGTGGEVGPAAARTAEAALPGPQVTEWADELSDRVIDGVGWLKARTTVPVLKVLRALVYGLIVVIAVVTAMVLAVLGVVRMWDVYIPVHPLGRRVWLGYVVLGGVLFLAGGVLLSRRGTAGGGRKA